MHTCAAPIVNAVAVMADAITCFISNQSFVCAVTVTTHKSGLNRHSKVCVFLYIEHMQFSEKLIVLHLSFPVCKMEINKIYNLS